jgi:formate hydrogenlyase subunit 4
MYGALIANFLIPSGIALHYAIAIFFVIQMLFAVIVGSIESFMARFRMTHNPQFILTLSSISLLIFLGVLLMLGRIA